MSTIIYYFFHLIYEAAWAIKASLCHHKWTFTGTFDEVSDSGARHFIDTYRCSKCQTYTRCPRSSSIFLREAPPAYGLRNYN